MADYYPNPPSDLPPGGSTYSPPNSTMAIVSLVSGILGLTFVPFLGSIVALVTGYMARNEIRDSGGTVGGDGLAVAGLILGWIGVGLGILGLCIGGVALLIPFCLLLFSVPLEQFNNLPNAGLFLQAFLDVFLIVIKAFI